MKKLTTQFGNDLTLLVDKYRELGVPVFFILVALGLITEELDKELSKEISERE